VELEEANIALNHFSLTRLCACRVTNLGLISERSFDFCKQLFRVHVAHACRYKIEYVQSRESKRQASELLPIRKACIGIKLAKVELCESSASEHSIEESE
jgi:hypothetical protein